jgi:hypothetical protein
MFAGMIAMSEVKSTVATISFIWPYVITSAGTIEK